MKGFILNHDLVRNFPKSPQSQSSSNSTTPETSQDASPQATEFDTMMFYGVLENGNSFIWRQTKPYNIAFFNEPIPKEYVAQTWRQFDKVFEDYRKNPLYGYFFNTQSALLELQSAQPDLEFYERDIIATEQFLMSKHIRGSLKFASEPDMVKGQVAYYTDPKVDPLKELYIPTIKTISIDIETGVKSDEIYAIGLYNENIKTVLLFDKKQKVSSSVKKDFAWGESISYPSEKELLLAFADFIEQENPHAFIGWNVVGFDFNFILRKFRSYDIEPRWGIGSESVVAFKADKSRNNYIIKIPGRVIIEGMDLVRNNFDLLPNYKLNTAAFYILDEKKTIETEGITKINEIEQLYENDIDELARYNISDSKLVFDIFTKLNGMDFVFSITLLSGVSLEKVFNPHEILEHFYLPQLHQKKVVAYRKLKSSIQINNSLVAKHFTGGYYQDVVVLKWTHLFLAVIMAYRIDPLGMVRANFDREHATPTPNGVFFHDKDNLLAPIIQSLLGLQTQAKEGGHLALLQPIEHILQQIIVALSSSYSRYYLPGLFEVICANAQLIMEAIINKLNTDAEVVFYDNFYIIIKLKESQEDFTTRIKEVLSDEFFYELFPRIPKHKNFLCRIEQQLFFKSFFLPPQSIENKNRSGVEYWALDQDGVFVKQGGQREILPLIESLSNQLIYRLLKQESVEEFLTEFKKNLLSGVYDEELVYKRNLSKRPSEYTTSVPPQAVAALKAKEHYEQENFFNRKVKYFQTENGPEPIEAFNSKIDYQHYLDREVIPALEKMLTYSAHSEFIAYFKNQDLQLSLF